VVDVLGVLILEKQSKEASRIAFLLRIHQFHLPLPLFGQIGQTWFRCHSISLVCTESEYVIQFDSIYGKSAEENEPEKTGKRELVTVKNPQADCAKATTTALRFNISPGR